MESFHLRGFSLIELLVVLGIITFIMSVVFTSQSTFNKTLILKNTAYDIALMLRTAETYGLGSRVSGISANAGYGLHFQRGTTDSFVLFADTAGGASCVGMAPDCKPGNNVYTSIGPTPDTLVQTYTLGNGITISDFCVSYASGNWSCANKLGTGMNITSLDVVFTRPNTNALMSVNGLYSPAPFAPTKACLIISSPQGAERFVSITTSGVIAANATSCP